MFYFSMLFPIYISGSFKTYGYTKINDEAFLTLVVGNCSSVSNGCSRFISKLLFNLFNFSWLL